MQAPKGIQTVDDGHRKSEAQRPDDQGCIGSCVASNQWQAESVSLYCLSAFGLLFILIFSEPGIVHAIK